MDRLTRRVGTDVYMLCGDDCWKHTDCNLCPTHDGLLQCLADYEDSGLTPEECAEYKKFEDEAVSKNVPFSRIVELMNAESEGRLIVLPCKVGDTVWFLGGNKGIVPERPFVVHEGNVTKIKSVTFSDGTVVFIADIYYEIPDPFYNDGRMREHEAICSFTEWGSWTRFYLTRKEAEAALKEAHNGE